jgi:hypothetical protein
MGPEPLVMPLIILGVLGLLGLVARMWQKRFATRATPVLKGAIAFSIWGAQGAQDWKTFVSIFLMATPFGIACAGVFVKLLGFLISVTRRNVSPTKPDTK